MLEKDKLRKADIFSGSIIFLFGLWIVSQGLKMPMKDSWGGVQNVWFVSPALFPLFVGGVISLLGMFLIRTALKTVGLAEFGRVLRWLSSPELFQFLKTPSAMRFYTITTLFLAFVFINIARVDFFLCSILFLVVFISIFYFDDDVLLKKLFLFYLTGTALFIPFFAMGVPQTLEPTLPHASDWLTVIFILVYCIYTWILIRHREPWRKKYRTALILAFAVPFIIGPIFKYFLLVPMPTEGLVVSLLDMIWYWEF